MHPPTLYVPRIEDDGDDDYCNDSSSGFSIDSSKPLYKSANVTVKIAAMSIMSMTMEFNFPKCVVDRILTVLKALLPSPNLMPTTNAAIIGKV